MKISFSDRENQHLEPTAAMGRAIPAPQHSGLQKPTFSQIVTEALTNPSDRGNLLVKYENLILISFSSMRRPYARVPVAG
jgi:hypothetical protein